MGMLMLVQEMFRSVEYFRVHRDRMRVVHNSTETERPSYLDALLSLDKEVNHKQRRFKCKKKGKLYYRLK